MNSGSEVIASGNIHIYGNAVVESLQAQVDMAQHQFSCNSLEAELISIAGTYCVADISQRYDQKPVHIYLNTKQEL